MTIRMVTKSPDEQLPGDKLKEIQQAARAAFAGGPSYGFKWSSGPVRRVLIYDDERLVSSLIIVDRVARLDVTEIRVGGIGGVFAVPEYQGQGHAVRMLTETRRIIFDEMQARAGMLLCNDRLLPYYARLGWMRLDCPIEMDQPDGTRLWPENAMILPREGDHWHPKRVHLGGPPW